MNGLELHALEAGHWRRAVNLTICPEEAVLLLGRNGAGKTTLLNTIAGLLPIYGGTLCWRGHDVTGLACSDRALHGIRIGLEGRQIFSRLTTRKNLLLGGYQCADAYELRADLERVLDLFPELRSKLDQPAGSLSGGQQTRVNIGRAIMGRPSLLLLDEPALGLDPRTVGQLVRSLQRLRADGMTLLIADQGPSFAGAFPDRVVVLAGGEVVFDGPWAEATEQGSLRAVLW
jgi:branched-chain amino acid transport system ATP-binding protein